MPSEPASAPPPDRANPAKPRIRILHQLARSGGTVICRCLASMDRVVLLSEIHPLGGRMFNPLQQAMDWYGLLRPAELEAARNSKLSFSAAILLIARRCEEQGKLLVIRDWNHLDYIGIPFTQPQYRPALCESLQAELELVRFVTVRHPLDQWLSLISNPWFADHLPLRKYLKGVRRFSEMATEIGFLHYEDFAADSDAALQKLCTRLELPFDTGYRDRWATYEHITGDVLPGRSKAGEIEPLPRQHLSQELIQRMTSRADYQRILKLLAYSEWPPGQQANLLQV